MTNEDPHAGYIVGYQERTPPAPLDRYVHRMAYGYFPAPLPPEQLAPDSYLKLALILDGYPRYYDGNGEPMDWHDGFCGHVPPEQGIIATSEAPVRCVMVNFYPSAFHQLFKLKLDGFNGRMIPPRQVIGDAIDRLYADMRAAGTPEGMFGVLETWLNGRSLDVPDPRPTLMERIEQAVRAAKGTVEVARLADDAGVSTRQMQRMAIDELGLPLKEFCSIVRFNHAYALMRSTGKLDLDTALAAGYYDQSHMLKDLSFYLGKAPKRFANLIRPMVDTSLGH